MTSVSYHPSTDLMLSYSAGAISPSHALCVATHLEFCSSCRQAHHRNNAIGGALLAEFKPTAHSEISADLKSAVLARLDRSYTPDSEMDHRVREKPTSARTVDTPRTLRNLLPQGFGPLSWRKMSLSASHVALFRDEYGSVVSLLKIKPGGQIARHRHLGKEYTIVLKGAFSDEDGVYKAGDFLLRDHSESHQPVATRDGDCLCLSLQEAPLQFTGWLFRLLNPWIKTQFRSV